MVGISVVLLLTAARWAACARRWHQTCRVERWLKFAELITISAGKLRRPVSGCARAHASYSRLAESSIGWSWACSLAMAPLHKVPARARLSGARWSAMLR